jgi:hypothetical protein
MWFFLLSHSNILTMLIGMNRQKEIITFRLSSEQDQQH